MKPIRIDIENIFGIKKTSLDFPETGLIAIQGPNGAGKSSILDSIVVSLFGEPPASRDVKNSDILSRQASRGTLSFVFETENGKRFSVTRMYKRSKRGQVTQTAEMSFLDGDKEEGVATGPDAVNEYIASVIWNGQGVTNKEGRDLVRVVKNAFLSSVFLAQGEMTRFLKMTPSELREIISSLFVLEEYAE
jgi:exonuclease SbcC